jgi:heparan-alpha-glucosaminide N-acetyltransferase
MFFLGLFLSTTNGTTFDTIRIFGVLQRFSVAYGVVSLLHLVFATTSVTAETRFQQIFYDVRMIWKQWIVIGVLVLVHLTVIFGLKVPSCERGYLGPGGIHEFGEHENCTGGATGFIDRSILGENHMYQRAKIRAVYNALVFDPEGIFGCLLTIVQVFLGMQCGVTLLVYPTARDRLRRWIFWGLGLAALTAVLTLFSINDGLIPINKNMWSLSFVSVTASLAFLLLSLIYYLVDVRNIESDFWTIFLYPGMNAILLYVENLWTVTVWILISHYLYHKKLFYSI